MNAKGGKNPLRKCQLLEIHMKQCIKSNSLSMNKDTPGKQQQQ